MMKGYRKLAVFALVFNLISILFITGCGTTDKNASGQVTEGGKVVVYTSLFPLYDFAKRIGGEYADVKSIVPPGAEPHDFEPSPKDMAALSEANLFIYNGAGYETWIDKVQQNLDPSKTKVVDASTGISLLNTTAEENEGTDQGQMAKGIAPSPNSGNAVKEHREQGMHDPHVWLDPMRAKQQALTIERAFSEVDPAHKEAYKANYTKLAADLDAIDQSYKDTLAKAKKKEFVTSHRAFAYLAQRYGLTQIAVTGISPSDEPSQKDLQHLIDTVKQHQIKYVTFEELVQSKVAETVQREAGAQAVKLNPLENVTKEEFAAGKSYVDLMKENLETLKKVLEVNG